ncbi:MAG: hypothetical protein COB67_00620 [SAR324 cluster bacterium]|uniref:Uncharacterized protein n=1 Tax=SAR324 cluster bacterium TaxID=2024889 RepID=A0A2A4TBJ6_9DELT|nr:MAG: hypothetical protein COB67_00620 [SAR324 cluster bacterium]
MTNHKLQELLNLILFTDEITPTTDNAHIEICDAFSELEQKLENGRQRYEANLMSMEDCSEMTTTQAFRIKELEAELFKYKEAKQA